MFTFLTTISFLISEAGDAPDWTRRFTKSSIDKPPMPNTWAIFQISVDLHAALIDDDASGRKPCTGAEQHFQGVKDAGSGIPTIDTGAVGLRDVWAPDRAHHRGGSRQPIQAMPMAIPRATPRYWPRQRRLRDQASARKREKGNRRARSGGDRSAKRGGTRGRARREGTRARQG